MLTVRHVEESGYEHVFPAKSIDYTPASTDAETKTNGSTLYGVVCAFGVGDASVSDDDCNRMSNGTIYVMNDAGRTVATYRF
jgi:hypothetical protein